MTRAALIRLVALLGVPLSFACGLGGHSEPPPHLVLITLDTLRADRLGSYGDTRDASPTLDAIARSGVRFEDAIAQATTTPPSHASILTGLNPARHGLRKLYSQRLAGENETLAEILHAAGYATAAFVSAVPLQQRVGLDQGFDVYDDRWDEPGDEPAHDRDARATNARIEEWLVGRPEGPVFLWVHYFDPHYPYFPPAEFRERFGVGGATLDFLPIPTNTNPNRRGGRAKPAPKEQAIPRMDALYQAEIAYMDTALGELQELLRGAGVLPNAVVAFVADHGEHLGESGYYFGHWDVLEETARVPMAIAHPDGRFAGQVVSETVGTIDLVPTLLAWLGIESSVDFDGRDLTPIIEGRETTDRFLYTEQFEYFPVRAVRNSEWMLQQKATAKQKVSAAVPRLYRRGPGVDLTGVDGEPKLRSRLLGALQAIAHPDQSHPTERYDVEDDVREQLRALGYTDEARDPAD